MSFYTFRRRASVLRTAAACAALLLLFLGRAAAGTYLGPVPPPTSGPGAPGPYAVETATVPSPLWSGRVVTVYHPVGAAGPRPTWFFIHGYGGNDPSYYDQLLRHWAGHGWTVVFSPYPTADNPPELYNIVAAGFRAAASAFPTWIDTTRVGFGGHSFGGGATPPLALRAFRDWGWGTQARCLYLLAPWYSYELTNADVASFPAGTQAIVQVYEDDLANDHRMAIDVFSRLNIPDADKDFVIVHSDQIEGHSYLAGHGVPTSGVRPGGEDQVFDALDTWVVQRLGEALAESCFNRDPVAHDVALGGGSPAQVTLGRSPAGVALRPLTVTDTPVPLYPQRRYAFPFLGLLNPRRQESLPSPDNRPRLTGLSARGYAGTDEATLIAGAVISGSTSKSLLVRAAGPWLRSLGLSGAVSNPALQCYTDRGADLRNDNWGEPGEAAEVVAAATAENGLTAFAAGSADAALTGTFGPGAVTMHVTAVDGRPGIALLEVYAADLDTSSELHSLSTRAWVGTEDKVLIIGLTVAGSRPSRLLVRGLGPALTDLGVSGALADPVITVYAGATPVATNDNWSAVAGEVPALTTAFAQSGVVPLATGSTDAALLTTLSPGNYTVIVAGKGATTGIGLAEVYLLPGS